MAYRVQIGFDYGYETVNVGYEKVISHGYEMRR